MDTALISPGGVPDVLAGGGEKGRLIAAMDWSKSPLGGPGRERFSTWCDRATPGG
jgi:hypothetical protein